MKNKIRNEKSNLYIKFKNRDGKIWIIPRRNIRMALNIYQPSSKKGRAIKRFLPLISSIPILDEVMNNIMQIESCTFKIDRKLDEKIKKFFKCDKYESIDYAFFLGTPSIHQKVTIQIFTKDNILGYCKYTNNNEIANIFLEEQRNLKYLEKKCIENIPKCLYCGEVNPGEYIFIQDTIKTNKSIIEHSILNSHVKFLEDMADKTSIACSYEESDYFNMIKGLEKDISFLEKDRQNITCLRKAIDIVNDTLKNMKNFSVYHGDFTPWNMFIESGSLYVFDFEYVKLKYPPKIDIFHYFTQVCIYEKGWNSERIFLEFDKVFIRGELNLMFSNSYVFYLVYLIDIIAFYTKREQGNFEEVIKNNIIIWLDLISKIIECIK